MRVVAGAQSFPVVRCQRKLQRSGLGTVDTAAPDPNSIKNGGVRTRTPPGI